MADQVLVDGWFTDGDIGAADDILVDDGAFGSGSSSIQFTANNANISLWSEWQTSDPGGIATVNDGRPAYAVGYIIARGNTAGSLQVDIETTTDFSSFNTHTFYTGSAKSATVWEAHGSVLSWVSAGTWARFKIHRPGDRSVQLWVDRAYFNTVPAFTPGHTPGTSGTFGATWADVAGLTTNTVNSQCTTAAGGFTADVPGAWSLSASVDIDDAISDGDMFGIRLNINSTLLGTYQIPGSSVGFPAALSVVNLKPALSVSHHGAILDAGDTVTVQVIQFTNTGALKDYSSPRFTAMRSTAEY